MIIPNGNYCVANFLINKRPTMVAAVSIYQEVDSNQPVITGWYIMSSVCLTLTIFFFVMEKYVQTVHRYYVMCYVSCQFISMTCLTLIAVVPDEIILTMACPLMGTYFQIFILNFFFGYYMD